MDYLSAVWSLTPFSPFCTQDKQSLVVQGELIAGLLTLTDHS